MSQGGKDKMKIKVKTQNGKLDKVTDNNNNPATPVTEADLQNIYNSPDGFKFVGVILYAESSPGCVYYISGGWAWKVCT